MANCSLSECLYGVQKSQSEIPFFDRCVLGDVLAFVDYALIVKLSQEGDLIAKKMVEPVKEFMTSIQYAANDSTKIDKLLVGLGETRFTGIGYAEGSNDGNGVGKVIAESLRDGIIFLYEAVKRGNHSFFTIPFALDNIRHDRSSDIIIALTKTILLDFTENLAKSEGWPTKTMNIRNVYDHTTQKWKTVRAQLPIVNGSPVILLPKRFINTSSHLDSIFRAFKRFLFEKYIKNDKAYAEYWEEGKQNISMKQFREIIKKQGRSYKSAIRDYVVSDYAIMDEFENHLSHVVPLTDEELESLQHCRN